MNGEDTERHPVSPSDRRSPQRSALRLIGQDSAAEPEELNLRILQPLFRYLRQQFGQRVLDQVGHEANLPPDFARRASAWISHRQFEFILGKARSLVTNDQEFQRATAYEMGRLYGPMLLVLRCMSVRSAYEMMANTSHMASKISRYEVLGGSRTSIRLRYTSSHPESRLACLSRQAQISAGSTVYWGLAPAVLEERGCIAHGDPACEYNVRWYEPVKWRTPVLLALTGFAISWMPLGFLAPWLAKLAVATGGALLGLIIEQRRMMADHIAFSEQTNHELERVVQAHARAVDEVLALHQRERRWNRRLEQQIADRSARLDNVVHRLETLGEIRRDKVRSLSHDINNPLTVLHGVALQLRQGPAHGAQSEEIIETLENTVGQISALVRELATTVREDPTPPNFDLEVVDVDELANRLRRQLRATVVGRDIRVTVFQTREAPKTIRTVSVMLERVIDNILTNAAKYTDRGSIVVEVGGTPGFLVLKVSDSGRGIAPHRLEQVLHTEGPDPNPPKEGSHGMGIGIVARILDQIGGRLEIMSEPGEGTTAWIYVPCESASGRSDVSSNEPIEGVLRRVVSIRSKHRWGAAEDVKQT